MPSARTTADSLPPLAGPAPSRRATAEPSADAVPSSLPHAAPAPLPHAAPIPLPHAAPEVYRPTQHVRIVTAASLFDGHDAAINIMRRILQASGAEVIHLGHNRSVRDIVDAAIQEDAQGIAVSSYQGGHMEFFRYMVDLLREAGCGHIRVFGGGGGTITLEEKHALEAYGVVQIFHPEDGRRLGLQGMINEILEVCDYDPLAIAPALVGPDGALTASATSSPISALSSPSPTASTPVTTKTSTAPIIPLSPDDWRGLARSITLAEAIAEGRVAHAGAHGLAFARGQEIESVATNGGNARAVAENRTVAENVAGVRRNGHSQDKDTHDGRKADTHDRHLANGHAAITPIVGITGTGGAGKSSFTDELVRRFTEDFPAARVAVLSVDPTKRRTGGALLGDRIRMNALGCGRVYMRSLATRQSGSEVSAALADAIGICRAAGFDLVIAETSGIGQADASIVGLVDLAVYVMTPEFGAQTQLEKIEMIDLADVVVINKYDKAGAEDALRDVRKAYQRAHNRFREAPDGMPVYPTMASQFNDRGCNTAYVALLELLGARMGTDYAGRFTAHLRTGLPDRNDIIPPRRVRYLSEIADATRTYKRWAAEQAELAGELWALAKAVAHFAALRKGEIEEIGRSRDIGGNGATGTTGATGATLGSEESGKQARQVRDDPQLEPFSPERATAAPDFLQPLMAEFNRLLPHLDPRCRQLIADWPAVRARYRDEVNRYQVRSKTIQVANFTQSLSHQAIPKVALPQFEDWASVLHWRLLENLPGEFPYTAGVFPFKRMGEDPTRMFAGEGGPWRTNKRFHYLSRHAEAKRLSTAFDSVTLYGEDPDRRPDIWGKVGNSGVSIAHVEDMEALYAGFDLTDPRTSVSMTINGPAPTILAFFFNAAIRQSLRKHLKAQGKIEITDADCLQPGGGGYAYADLRARVADDEYARIAEDTVARLRGTVQADILKEDQAQNTCIFSTEFALKMMGDVQQWFIDHNVKNFYSVSISGYHIAEAGANPISQLAFTLANGFTFVEYYLARGMSIDAFAANLSFFFSNGMDPEYAVIGRVARRVWATAMQKLYGANARSQQLKYHIQTSGRSLHAQEIDFNDIRTTLQALLAIYDNCNSLHTNAYDEAITTPTEDSVRRAVAIQLIINHEFGVAKNENPNQGAFIIDELTELVEEAVLAEFDRLTERGGVLGAMERMYQRSRIQEESLYYEGLKHSGELPIIGVNTYLHEEPNGDDVNGGVRVVAPVQELIRSSEEEKEDQLRRLLDFQARHADQAPAATARLKEAAIRGENVFGELMRAVECLSLGQVTHALYEVGGQYRRNM